MRSSRPPSSNHVGILVIPSSLVLATMEAEEVSVSVSVVGNRVEVGKGAVITDAECDSVAYGEVLINATLLVHSIVAPSTI